MSAEQEKNKIEHPYDKESYTDTFTRMFQEMDFVGQDRVKNFSFYAQIFSAVS